MYISKPTVSHMHQLPVLCKRVLSNSCLHHVTHRSHVTLPNMSCPAYKMAKIHTMRFFRTRVTIYGALLRKMTYYIGHPMGLRHPVPLAAISHEALSHKRKTTNQNQSQ